MTDPALDELACAVTALACSDVSACPLLLVRPDEAAMVAMAEFLQRRGIAVAQVDWSATTAVSLHEHVGGYRTSPAERRIQHAAQEPTSPTSAWHRFRSWWTRRAHLAGRS